MTVTGCGKISPEGTIHTTLFHDCTSLGRQHAAMPWKRHVGLDTILRSYVYCRTVKLRLFARTVGQASSLSVLSKDRIKACPTVRLNNPGLTGVSRQFARQALGMQPGGQKLCQRIAGWMPVEKQVGHVSNVPNLRRKRARWKRAPLFQRALDGKFGLDLHPLMGGHLQDHPIAVNAQFFGLLPKKVDLSSGNYRAERPQPNLGCSAFGLQESDPEADRSIFGYQWFPGRGDHVSGIQME